MLPNSGDAYSSLTDTHQPKGNPDENVTPNRISPNRLSQH